MSGPIRPVDDAARERARRDHESSLVIEAGAGTGKTTLLVDRLLALIVEGRARLDQIAAVTFTENAATTMKLRLRTRLESARSDAALTDQQRVRAGVALESIERAQVSTIHSLCGAILGERPLDCGVVPGFRMADDAEIELLFDEAWEEWLAGALLRAEEAVLAALDAEIPIESESAFGGRFSLRGLARVLVEQRDLEPLVADDLPDPSAWRDELLEQARRARQLAGGADPGDLLTQHLAAFAQRAEAVRFLEGAELARHLVRLEGIRRNYGQKRWWPSGFEEAKAIVEWTHTAPARWRAGLSADLHGRVVRSLRGVVAIYERLKRDAGSLDFLDLLFLARNALRDKPAVRTHVQRRFPFVLIDEFQDTDPLQVEIARFIAGDRPGALVIVGDAKQSIYRFRRAEVTEFQRLIDEARLGTVGGAGGPPPPGIEDRGEGTAPRSKLLQLSQNFRSRPAILRFANRVFGELIQRSDEAGQPAYEPVLPRPDLGDEPAVVALRLSSGTYLEGDELLQAESAALAAWIARASKGGQTVREAHTGIERPSRAGDVMVLARRLSKVRILEDTLEAAGLRFTVEGGKSFFDRQEVHEVLACCRAIDDPSDRVSLVAALRSSFFGVSDRDLGSFVLAGGRLWMGADVDQSLPGALALAPPLVLLQDLHRRRTRGSVAGLLEQLYDETRILAALTGTRRGEAQVANLEKVVALARKSSELGVLTLRGFTRLLEARIRNSGEEPDLPATRPGDPDTIRVLTVHKAKGLEAPLVCVYDTADKNEGSVNMVPLREAGRIAVGFRSGCQPPGWEALVQREKARGAAEGKRLLYVAATRARDRLVIPVPASDAQAGGFWKDLWSRLPAASDADVEVIDAETLPVPQREEESVDLKALATASGGDATGALWDRERAELIAEASHRPYVPISTTRHVAARAPAPVAAAAPGGGRDFGALVHRILEWIPLDQPERAEAMAIALAPSFGLDASAATRAGEAARRALDLPVMRRAREARRVWRELPLWLPEDGKLIEGVADLVFEEHGALVLVDYKTDHIAPEQALAQAAHHAPQLQVYGRGLAQATGLSVRERLVLFTAIGHTVPV